MKKYLTFIATGSSFLLTAGTALAQRVDISQPTGSVGTICLTNIPKFVINLAFIVGVSAAVIFLIYGGVKWILSGGDEKKVEAARNHIVAAIIGLIIVIGAYFIIGLVLQILGVTANPLSNLNFFNILGNPITC